MKLIYNIIILFISFFTFVFLNGCKSDDPIISPADNFEFSYTSTRDTIMSDFANVLVLDTVKVLLKDIKLNVSSSNDSTNFKVGPYVLYLRLNTTVNSIGSALIPSGTYDKVKFEVHKLEPNETPPDSDFVDANGRYSVVCKGRFNGNIFIYKSQPSAKQILQFPNNLVITPSKTNVTLLVRPQIWFIKNNDYMDPNNSANWNDIDNNIKNNVRQNFKIFKDNDKNGIPDN